MTDYWNEFPRLKKRLAEVESALAATLDDPSYPLAAETKTLVFSGGKFLRPALVLIGAGFGGSRGAGKIAQIAAALELLHAATLVHDDVLDRAERRRGTPTLHTKFGTVNAILAGDWMFSRSFRLIADHADIRSARILARFVGTVCSAEIRQDLAKFSFSASRRAYMRTIAGKTAALFSLSLNVGGQEAKASPLTVQTLRRAGYNLGMAFQIIDDILDYESDEATLGKPAGNDIREGLCTLPLILALETHRPALETSLSVRPIGEAQVATVLGVVADSGALEKARAIARSFTARALSEIASLPECPARIELADLTDRLLSRTY